MNRRLIVRFGLSLLVLAAALFVSAGTLRFWEGWGFFALLAIANLFMAVYLARTDRRLLQRRLEARETSTGRQAIRVGGILLWMGAMVLAGLDFRFGWSRGFPAWLVALGWAGVLAGLGLLFAVLRVNRFAGTTIRVEAEQKVISTGLYGVVRHPMYSGMVLMAIFTPLALGSWVAVPLSGAMLVIGVLRLLGEEKVLRQELPGYAEYCTRTRWRLAPYLF